MAATTPKKSKLISEALINEQVKWFAENRAAKPWQEKLSPNGEKFLGEIIRRALRNAGVRKTGLSKFVLANLRDWARIHFKFAMRYDVDKPLREADQERLGAGATSKILIRQNYRPGEVKYNQVVKAIDEEIDNAFALVAKQTKINREIAKLKVRGIGILNVKAIMRRLKTIREEPSNAAAQQTRALQKLRKRRF